MAVSSPVTKHNPRPRKYATAAARQAAYRSRNEMLEFRAETKTADTLTRIADTIDVSRSDLVLSMVKFALANHDWARFGLTHKTIPYYEGNPIMATKKPTAKQLAARKKFVEMVRSGAFKKNISNKRKKNPTIQYIVYSELSPEKYKQMLVTENKQRAISVANVNQMDGYHSVVEDQVGHLIYDAKTRKDYLQSNPSKRKKTVSQKISQLVHEGYPQKQAVAVALSEQRAGKVKRNPIEGEQHLFGNKYATIRKDADGRFVAQIYEKVKTGIGEEIDFWGVKYYKTQAGAQRYLDSLKPLKNNPQKRKVSAVVLMNPKAKKPQKYYQVSIMQEGLHKTWMPMAHFFTFSEAENYSHYLAKQHKNWSIRVHDKRAM